MGSALQALYADRRRAVDVMKTAIILHNIIVEAWRDRYSSDLYELAVEASNNGHSLDENGEEK